MGTLTHQTFLQQQVTLQDINNFHNLHQTPALTMRSFISLCLIVTMAVAAVQCATMAKRSPPPARPPVPVVPSSVGVRHVRSVLDMSCQLTTCFVDPCMMTRCASGTRCKSCNCQAQCVSTTGGLGGLDLDNQVVS